LQHGAGATITETKEIYDGREKDLERVPCKKLPLNGSGDYRGQPQNWRAGDKMPRPANIRGQIKILQTELGKPGGSKHPSGSGILKRHRPIGYVMCPLICTLVTDKISILSQSASVFSIGDLKIGVIGFSLNDGMKCFQREREVCPSLYALVRAADNTQTTQKKNTHKETAHVARSWWPGIAERTRKQGELLRDQRNLDCCEKKFITQEMALKNRSRRNFHKVEFFPGRMSPGGALKGGKMVPILDLFVPLPCLKSNRGWGGLGIARGRVVPLCNEGQRSLKVDVSPQSQRNQGPRGSKSAKTSSSA